MDHHYMPQFLLKPWCGEDKKVAACHRGRHGKLIDSRFHPRSTGFVEDLYRQEASIPGAPAALLEDPNEIETKGYSPLDNDACLIRDRFLSGVGPSQLSERELDRWAQFIATLEERTPREVARTEALARSAARDVVERVRAVGPDAADFLAPFDPDAIALNSARGMPFAERALLIAEVRRLSAVVLRVGDAVEFITADYPLAFFQTDKERGGLALPLSPKHVYLAASMPKEQLVSELGIQMGFVVNVLLIRQRPNYVYSTSRLEDGPVFPLRSLAERWLQVPDHLREDGPAPAP